MFLLEIFEAVLYINDAVIIKVCLYRTRPRLGGVREGMVEIKQTKVVHTERDRGTRL